jgi:choline dehydrogenase
LKRRSGARDYVVDTLQAKKEDGSPKYPLTVSYNSLATRVLFSNSTLHTTPRAYGVEYLVGEGLYAADSRYNASQTGELATVRASREVIVAGGAFNTPQILKLSGVGPREELEALGIHVVSDLPAVV